MDAILQQVEEEITTKRFPITANIIKNDLSNNIMTAKWLKWYNIGSDLYAQVGWEPQNAYDHELGRMADSTLAEEVVRSHNLILEDVQKPDFVDKALGRKSAEIGVETLH